MGEVRRATSVAVVRLQALCLLERLAHLGPGARAAGERRRVVKELEERRRREAQAYRMAHLNLGLGREGRACVPSTHNMRANNSLMSKAISKINGTL